MNALHCPTLLPAARAERGFTLVELMVTVAIALFLLAGLVTIVQNVRQADINQRALSQLQDQERFALTVITDVVQAGGYVPDATLYNPAIQLSNALAPWENGEAIYGTRVAPASDTLSARYMTAQNDGVILCDGSTNTAFAPTNIYINTFSVQQPPAVPAGQGGLYCQVNNGGASAAAPGVLLAPGVVGMKVYYGVKRDFAFSDYNVDTYLTGDQMCGVTVNPCGTDDWSNVSSVRVILTFTNPLFPQPGQQPTITFERVIEVMARGGVHT